MTFNYDWFNWYTLSWSCGGFSIMYVYILLHYFDNFIIYFIFFSMIETQQWYCDLLMNNQLLLGTYNLLPWCKYHLIHHIMSKVDLFPLATMSSIHRSSVVTLLYDPLLHCIVVAMKWWGNHSGKDLRHEAFYFDAPSLCVFPPNYIKHKILWNRRGTCIMSISQHITKVRMLRPKIRPWPALGPSM